MKKLLFVLVFAMQGYFLIAQPAEQKDTSWKKEFRETATRINDLVHTKLDVKFDYAHSYLNGKAWITLKPHFYSTDSLTLDAKGMDIHKIAMVKGSTLSDLKFKNDGWQLRITLDKKYKGGEQYTVYIDYTAKPNEVEVKGSAAAFVRIEGAASTGVQVAGNTLNGIKPVEASAEVKPGAFTDTAAKPVAQRPAARAPVPAILPGKGLLQHDFLFAGEWDTRKDSQTVFIIRKGHVDWSYAIPIKDHNNVLSEFSDVHMLSNGDVLYACKTGAAEVSPAKKLVWSFECPAGTECHSAQPVGTDKVFLCLNGTPAKAMLINKKTGAVEMEHEIPTARPGDPKSVHG